MMVGTCQRTGATWILSTGACKPIIHLKLADLGFYRYLFRLIVAMDANFKMKNRIRAREHDDPSLGPGWGAFVEPKRYKKHLRKYVAEKDVRI